MGDRVVRGSALPLGLTPPSPVDVLADPEQALVVHLFGRSACCGVELTVDKPPPVRAWDVLRVSYEVQELLHRVAEHGGLELHLGGAGVARAAGVGAWDTRATSALDRAARVHSSASGPLVRASLSRWSWCGVTSGGAGRPLCGCVRAGRSGPLCSGFPTRPGTQRVGPRWTM